MSLFAEEDPEIAAFGEDLAFPLALDGQSDLAVVSGQDNLLSQLPTRAVTGLGEVVTAPNDGIDFDEFQNGLADDVTRMTLKARLLEQYKRDDRLASLTATIVEGAEPGTTLALLDATTRTGFPLSTEVPFGSA